MKLTQEAYLLPAVKIVGSSYEAIFERFFGTGELEKDLHFATSALHHFRNSSDRDLGFLEVTRLQAMHHEIKMYQKQLCLSQIAFYQDILSVLKDSMEIIPDTTIQAAIDALEKEIEKIVCPKEP